MTRNKEKGMVMVTVLLIIAMLSLLVVTQMQMVLLDYKAVNQLSEQHQRFFQLEANAQRLAARKFEIQPACIIRDMDANAVIRLLKNKQGCALTSKKKRFYYLIEDLGLFACLQTIVNGVIYSTQHLRISLLSEDQPSAILQWRVAKLAQLISCESAHPTFIKSGLLGARHSNRFQEEGWKVEG